MDHHRRHFVAAASTRTVRLTVAALMLIEAASLAVASALHLAGGVTGRSELFDADDAGIAEATIGLVLVGGAIAMLRWPARARTVGLACIGFATVGFLVGLSITARSGHWPDIAYHLTVLPLLIGSLIVLWRVRRTESGPPDLAGRLGSASPPGRS